MRIHVTEEDIQNGLKGELSACPVALALRRETGKVWRVSGNRIRLLIGDNPAIELSDSTGTWVSKFDLGMRVAPFEFDIEMPEDKTNG